MRTRTQRLRIYKVTCHLGDAAATLLVRAPSEPQAAAFVRELLRKSVQADAASDEEIYAAGQQNAPIRDFDEGVAESEAESTDGMSGDQDIFGDPTQHGPQGSAAAPVNPYPTE
jgi:hypothetical protein